MKISTKNVLKGTVKIIESGAVNTEVVLEISPGVKITSIVTKSSAERLELSISKEIYAVVKASDVIVAID